MISDLSLQQTASNRLMKKEKKKTLINELESVLVGSLRLY